MDPHRLRALLDEHQHMVYSIALRMTRDPGTAEEVAQDVFLELYRSADNFDGADHLRFWLRRVAVHRATDALRRQKRQPAAHAEVWGEEHEALQETRAPHPAHIVSHDLSHRLELMVGSLPEAMRAAIVLRYGEDLAPDEIGRLLQQPVATVKSNLQRGLKLLRNKAAVTMKEYLREHRT